MRATKWQRERFTVNNYLNSGLNKKNKTKKNNNSNNNNKMIHCVCYVAAYECIHLTTKK